MILFNSVYTVMKNNVNYVYTIKTKFSDIIVTMKSRIKYKQTK